MNVPGRRAVSDHQPDKSKIVGPLANLLWQPMDATHEWWDGAILLVAVPVCKYQRAYHPRDWDYEYAVLRISCDEHYISVAHDGGADWGWELSDVDWYVVIRD